MNRFQVHQVHDRIRWCEWPACLVTQPVKRDQFPTAVLPDNFQEHGADKWHFPGKCNHPE